MVTEKEGWWAVEYEIKYYEGPKDGNNLTLETDIVDDNRDFISGWFNRNIFSTEEKAIEFYNKKKEEDKNMIYRVIKIIRF